jgi:hypothetical protein
MVILPACHEILFRGLVFTNLSKAERIAGLGEVASRAKIFRDAAVTTVLLEILTVGLSGDVRGLGSTIAFAAAATYVRMVTKSLYPSVAMHVAYYASVIAVVWKPAWAQNDIPKMWAAGGAAVALVCIVLFRTVTADPKLRELGTSAD